MVLLAGECPGLTILPLFRWFCHVDDDNYVNVRTLVKHLSQYPHTQDMYIGKPSLDRPIEATERLGDNKMVRRTVLHLMPRVSDTTRGYF